MFTVLLLADHFPISSLSLRSLSVSAALSQRAEPSRVEPPEQKQAQLMRKTMAGSALTSACIAIVAYVCAEAVQRRKCKLPPLC